MRRPRRCVASIGSTAGDVLTDQDHPGTAGLQLRQRRSALPRKASSLAAVLAEVGRITSNNPDPNALYAVYTDIKRGNASYCGWHGWGTLASAFFRYASSISRWLTGWASQA